MIPSRGIRFLAIFFLSQVLSRTDALQSPSQFFQGSQFSGALTRDPAQQSRSSPGYSKNGLHSTPSQPDTQPDISEEDVVVLIGSDLQVPYPLYQQISNSFLLSKDILVLMPNNTIVKVSGYVDLKELAKKDPDDTKVLISSDSMIPAPIYLRIVLIRPEEVMLKLPNGEILPNQMYRERYGVKPGTKKHGGQTYFSSVSEEDSFPFLVFNDRNSINSIETSKPIYDSKFDTTDSGRAPFSDTSLFTPALYPNPKPVHEPSQPQHLPYFSPQEPGSRPRPYTSRYQGRLSAAYSEPCVNRRPVVERNAHLPPGVHIIDNDRCCICDPSAPDTHVTVFVV